MHSAASFRRLRTSGAMVTLLSDGNCDVMINLTARRFAEPLAAFAKDLPKQPHCTGEHSSSAEGGKRDPPQCDYWRYNRIACPGCTGPNDEPAWPESWHGSTTVGPFQHRNEQNCSNDYQVVTQIQHRQGYKEIDAHRVQEHQENSRFRLHGDEQSQNNQTTQNQDERTFGSSQSALDSNQRQQLHQHVLIVLNENKHECEH